VKTALAKAWSGFLFLALRALCGFFALKRGHKAGHNFQAGKYAHFSAQIGSASARASWA
jgi:hypothetical protein